jgi:hypothetical protein
LDPDLVESRRKDNVENWTAAFGQINQSAKYLRNQQVGEGKNGEEYILMSEEMRVANYHILWLKQQGIPASGYIISEKVGNEKWMSNWNWH